MDIQNQHLNKLNKLGRTILGPAATQIGELLGDTARYWRLRNLASLSDKFDAKCRERGIDLESGRTIALSIGLPLLAKASYQDDDFLQDRWANLLAASMEKGRDETKEFSLDVTFIDALGQFSQLDCHMLEYVVEHGIKGVQSKEGSRSMMTEPLPETKIRQAFPNSNLVHASLEKLVHLGCVDRVVRLPLTPKKKGDDSGGTSPLIEDIVPTLMGINLYINSSGKTPQWADRELDDDA